jgi:aromatic ring-opening dioxygenase catalytic subunit (LigB family)
MTKTPTLPVFYISHGGGPCFFMDWSSIGPADTWKKMDLWLRNLSKTIGQTPKAILVISAHWEEQDFTVMSHANPPMLFDYSGFPKNTYELKYPAPGSPELADRVRELLSDAGIPAQKDTKRGFDHGVFVPFLLIYPDAKIPVIQLSLKEGLDPEEHLKMGRALAPLRDEGVLIVGSGMSYHNLSEFFSGKNVGPVSDTFDSWLTKTVTSLSVEERNQKLEKWSQAPGARQAHPREEHLIPLMVVAGAAGPNTGNRIFTDRVMGATTSAYRFG